jgi:thiamine biosynthesis lipoprotein
MLKAAPARRPGAPDPRAHWRQVQVDHEARVIRRPTGVRIDLGGTGKGLAADACGVLLAEEPRFAIDCGGDVRVGGADAQQDPFEVAVAHPLTGRIALTFPLIAGGVATSGIDRRTWRRGNRHGHHLIDPATAVAPTTLEADVLAKAAVLAGAEQGRVLLRAHGGVLFHEGGHAERVALDSAVAQRSLEPYRVAA